MMPELNLSLIGLYLAAALVLAITPGPGILFVMAQTAKGGKSAGVSASFGTAIGGFFHVIMGALGVSALVYSSARTFELVKLAGALYLFFLGFKALREKTVFSAESIERIKYDPSSLRQGIVTEALNPKTALFFLAFIPQFVDPSTSVAGQFILLGSLSVILNTSADLVAVAITHTVLRHLRRSARGIRAFRYFSASAYFGLGALALSAKRAS